jgi:hypothetical protein
MKRGKPAPHRLTATDKTNCLDLSGGISRRLSEPVAVLILLGPIAAVYAIEDGDPSYAHTILLALELDLKAWREAA